jgi:aquaporin Z
MILQAFVEFLGTFLFLFVILEQSQPIAIAVALLAVIYAFGSISGGHFNPAVTVMMGMHNKIEIVDAIVYIVAQVLGGICAFLLYKHVESLKLKKL